MNPDDVARMRDAMRDLASPSNHLTIVETESMVVITSADGRTTRLSPDGKKIKDDNTGIERKTKWDGDKLVVTRSISESLSVTQTMSLEDRKLTVVNVFSVPNPTPVTLTYTKR